MDEEPVVRRNVNDPVVRAQRAADEPVLADRPVVEVVRRTVRWPGVWAGFLIAMGVLVILTALGLAVGATAISNSGNAAGLGRGAAWWGGISFLIALFIGGAVSARWVTGSLTSVLQGALVWVLAVVAVFYMATAGISLGAQGLFAALSSPANSAMQQMANNINQATQVGTTGTNAAAAAQSAAPTAWVTFIVLCISAIAAIVGGLAGRQKDVYTRV